MKKSFTVMIVLTANVSLYSQATLHERLQQLKEFANYEYEIIRYNPFGNLKKEVEQKAVAKNTDNQDKAAVMTKKPQTTPQVISIFNDKAYIQNRWYGVEEEVEGYKVIKIVDNGVYLKKDDINRFYPLHGKEKSLIELQKVQND